MDLSISSKTTWILKPIPTLILKDETLYMKSKKGKKKKRISYKYLNSSEELDGLKCHLETQWS
jgi:hypothetical protein